MNEIMANPLVEAMSDEQLREMAQNHPSESVKALAKGVLDIRAKARLEKALEDKFLEELSKVELPPPPSRIGNIYRAWQKLYRPLNKAERKEYLKLHPETTKEQLDAKQIDTGQWGWGKWEINKAFSVPKASGTSPSPKTSATPIKRAITAKRIEGEAVKVVGNFRSGNEACEYLKLETGGDSAIRVLQRNGYIIEPYTGTDFTVKA